MKLGWFIILSISFFNPIVHAAESLIPLESAHIEPENMASLQRGARLYMNYCAGCHSLRYTTYGSMGNIIGLVDEQGKLDKNLLMSNLVFGHAETKDAITVSMDPDKARNWFGIVPPDLTLIARVRGVDWLYTYLKSFYKDESRIWGTNNLVFPDVAMPNVLLALQGELIPIYDKDDNNTPTFRHLKLEREGQYSPAQFDTAIRDLVNFLYVIAEPTKTTRYNLGWYVLGFLLLLCPLLYLLKREFWKDLKRSS